MHMMTPETKLTQAASLEMWLMERLEEATAARKEAQKEFDETIRY